jgi:hypothetical protein
MSDPSTGLEGLNRPITQAERQLVCWLLERSDSSHRHLASQLDSLNVVSKCNCGCPTVYFAVDGDPPTRKGEAIISDYLGEVDEQEVGIMLFELSGKSSSLEVYSCAGHDKAFGLPSVSTLYRWEDASKRGAALTEETLRNSANGLRVQRADDADELFKKLGI